MGGGAPRHRNRVTRASATVVSLCETESRTRLLLVAGARRDPDSVLRSATATFRRPRNDSFSMSSIIGLGAHKKAAEESEWLSPRRVPWRRSSRSCSDAQSKFHQNCLSRRLTQ